MTDWRALCAELAEELQRYQDDFPATTDKMAYRAMAADAALNRARTALAEPQGEGPTDEELMDVADLRDAWNAQADALNTWDELGLDEIICWAQRQALARWGRPAPPPADDGPAVPEGGEPASVDDEATAALALRVQRLEEMRETEKAALLDAFRQIDDLKQRIDFQYWKIHQLEEATDLNTSENV